MQQQPTTAKQKLSHKLSDSVFSSNYLKAAAGAAAAILLFGGVIYLSNSVTEQLSTSNIASQDVGIVSWNKAKLSLVRSDNEVVKFGRSFEQASKRIKQNDFDLDAILLRAESAEELNLFGQAIEDYKNYLGLSKDSQQRSRIEAKLARIEEKLSTPVKVEPTDYESLNGAINSYLKALIKKDATLAKEHLEAANKLALKMLQKTGERAGVDTVEYYSKVDFDAARKLLKARRETEEVSKIVAIDNFQECINRLEKAKFIFVEHESITDLQTNVSLLAKFLPRVGRVNEARRKTDIWLKVAEEKGYLFNRAQLLYQQSQIAVYQGLEDLGVEKSLECLEICSRIGVEKFTLYPLLLMSQVQAEFGQSDAAFTRSVDGIIGSLKYQNPAFTSQFLQYAGLASFGLNMPELAEAYIKESIRISTQEEMFGYLAVAKTALAALLAEKGKFAKAKQLIEETKTEDISRISEPIAKKQHLFRVSGYEGKVYGLAREFSKAEQSYRKSLRLAEELGYEKILGLYQNVQGLGESLREQDKNHEALKELLKAKDIYQKSVVNLRIKGKNRLLDVTFSGRGIDEAISLVKTKR